MKKCVFFDRDGVVNRAPDRGKYVERWEDFRLLRDFVSALRVAREAGFEAVVVTNQRGVALGIMSLETVEDMHRRLRGRLRQVHGLDILDILTCPHAKGVCECRKPKPGMLLDAARRHGLDLKASWMVGDSESDVEAGRAAGCRTILVSPDAGAAKADFVIADTGKLAELLKKVLPNTEH